MWHTRVVMGEGQSESDAEKQALEKVQSFLRQHGLSEEQKFQLATGENRLSGKMSSTRIYEFQIAIFYFADKELPFSDMYA